MEKSRRAACVAGSFYPDSAVALRRCFAALEAAPPRIDTAGESVRAVILPHAGYVYSLPTAFRALRLARNGGYRRAILLAPSHSVWFSGAAAGSFAEWETPLGISPVDLELQNALSPAVSDSSRAVRQEHALEVQLPLLQFFFGALPIVPLAVGELNGERRDALADALRKYFTEETLFLISSDFTHYGPRFDYAPFGITDTADALKKLDFPAAELVESGDLAGFEAYCDRTGATICGANPIRVLLKLCENNPGIRGKLIDYSNSCETAGPSPDGVGYASFVFLSVK